MGCAQAQHSGDPGFMVSDAEAPALVTSQLSKPNSLDEVQH